MRKTQSRNFPSRLVRWCRRASNWETCWPSSAGLLLRLPSTRTRSRILLVDGEALEGALSSARAAGLKSKSAYYDAAITKLASRCDRHALELTTARGRRPTRRLIE